MQEVPEYPEDTPPEHFDVSPQFAQRVQRAEALMEQAGRNVRSFITIAGMRLSQYGQQAQSRLRAAASSEEEKTSSGDTNATASQAQERASAMVDAASQRMGQAASNLGRQFQRVIALAREEGEDIWAEAQHLRQSVHNGAAADESDDADGASTPSGRAHHRRSSHRKGKSS